jgi:hypothetical protein
VRHVCAWLTETWHCRVPLGVGSEAALPLPVPLWALTTSGVLLINARMNFLFHAERGFVLGAAAYAGIVHVYPEKHTHTAACHYSQAYTDACTCKRNPNKYMHTHTHTHATTHTGDCYLVRDRFQRIGSERATTLFLHGPARCVAVVYLGRGRAGDPFRIQGSSLGRAGHLHLPVCVMHVCLCVLVCLCALAWPGGWIASRLHCCRRRHWAYRHREPSGWLKRWQSSSPWHGCARA